MFTTALYNNGIKYEWGKVYEWKPGANTVAYYPLKADTNDHYGNNNLSNTGITFSTGYGYFNGSAYATKNGSLFTGNPTFTASIWLKSTSNIGAFAWAFGNIETTNSFGIWTYDGSGRLYIGGWNNDRNTGYVINTNTWYNVIFTYSGGNGVIYVNGNKIYNGTRSPTIGNGFTYIGVTPAGTQYAKWNGYLSDAIFENKVRTQQEATDYYNRSKKNYIS